MWVGGDDMPSCKMTTGDLNSDIADIDRPSRYDVCTNGRLVKRSELQRLLKPKACVRRAIMQRMAPGHAWRFGLVDLIRAYDRRVWECRGVSDEGLEKLARKTHRHRIRDDRLRCLEIRFGR